MKRILFVNLVGETSGSIKSLYLIIEQLDRSKYEPFLLIARKGDFENKINKLCVKTFYSRLGQIRNTSHSPIGFNFETLMMFGYFFLRLPLDIIIVYRLVKKYKIDLVHINVSTLYSVGLAAKILGVPIIWHIREIFNNNMLKKIQQFIINFCSYKIIAITKFSTEGFNKDKVCVVYNGIKFIKPKDIKDVKELRLQLNLPLNSLLFLTFGNISNKNINVKGIFDLLYSIAINEGYNKACFLICGLNKDDKSYQTAKQLTQELNIEPFVRLYGIIQNINDYINASDVIIVPHRAPEAFGRTIIEAAQFRKPVICSKLPPSDEILIDNFNGKYFTSGNIESLSKTINSFINNQEIISIMGNNNYLYAKNKFNSVKNNKKIFSLYKDILE